MMDAVALSAGVKKLQQANPTLQFCIDEFGSIRVNGIDYGGDEYWGMKHPVKRALQSTASSCHDPVMTFSSKTFTKVD